MKVPMWSEFFQVSNDGIFVVEYYFPQTMLNWGDRGKEVFQQVNKVTRESTTFPNHGKHRQLLQSGTFTMTYKLATEE